MGQIVEKLNWLELELNNAFSSQNWDSLESIDDSINQYCRELMRLVDCGELAKNDAKQAMDALMSSYRSLLELVKKQQTQVTSQLKRMNSEKEAIKQYASSIGYK
ncbi:MAG: hypothetical protein CSA50_07885 [Gammaproteobacteria bacterium]|nr:MAG: hypothetical protein CSA50_07885 [Gammaproteobacteria bacterium]